MFIFLLFETQPRSCGLPAHLSQNLAEDLAREDVSPHCAAKFKGPPLLTVIGNLICARWLLS